MIIKKQSSCTIGGPGRTATAQNDRSNIEERNSVIVAGARTLGDESAVEAEVRGSRDDIIIEMLNGS